jgi:hypothetical protein
LDFAPGLSFFSSVLVSSSSGLIATMNFTLAPVEVRAVGVPNQPVPGLSCGLPDSAWNNQEIIQAFG